MELQCRIGGRISEPELDAEVESELTLSWPRLGSGLAHGIILLLIRRLIEDSGANAMVLIVERASIRQILDLSEHLHADAPMFGEIVFGAPAILES